MLSTIDGEGGEKIRDEISLGEMLRRQKNKYRTDEYTRRRFIRVLPNQNLASKVQER
jgi:hypothetical protein